MYVVTFERKVRIDGQYQWLSDYEVYDELSDVKSFLEKEYDHNYGGFGNTMIYHVSDTVSFTRKTIIDFEKE